MKAWVVIATMWVGVGCKKHPPRFEGPLRVQLGDCALDTTWASGPRPVPPGTAKVASSTPPAPSTPPEKPPDPDPATARRQAIDAARQAGILGVRGRGGFASLTGTGDLSSGFDDAHIYGGLLGNEPGGGGTGTGIGIGRYGTIGHGAGRSGYGPGGMRGRGTAVPTISIGAPEAKGDLDKAIIRRYIRRNIQKIQYCYEKELLSDPKLLGTVTVDFSIKPDGIVASATGNGMDPSVASCVASVIKAIEFPKPKGGGVVNVRYPFTFRPAGSTAPIGGAAPPLPPLPDPPKPEPAKPAAKPIDAAHYEPGATSPLAPQVAAIEDCLRANPTPYGAAVVALEWTGNAVTGASVTGVSDDVAACIAGVAKQLTRTTGALPKQHCSLAFGEMPIAELPGIDITDTAVTYASKPVADPRKLEDKPTLGILGEQLSAAIKSVQASTAPLSIDGPLAIRPLDATPIATVIAVVRTVIGAGGDYVLAARQAGAWKLLRPIAIPVVPVPRGKGGMWSAIRRGSTEYVEDEHVTLSLLVQKERTWLGLSRVNEFQEIPAGAGYEDKLREVLHQHKRSAFFADRTDLEVTGEGVTYADVVRAIEIARDQGFVDWVFVSPGGLTARPTL